MASTLFIYKAAGLNIINLFLIMDYRDLTSTITREQQLGTSAAFPILMRKVYLIYSGDTVITGNDAVYIVICRISSSI